MTRVDDHRAATAIWILVLSPLAVLPGGFEQFSLPKLLVATIGVAIGLSCLASGALPRGVAWLAGAVVAVFVVAATVSETPLASLLGRWPRYQGLPALLVYGGCAVVGAALFATRHPARLCQLRSVLQVVAVALAVTAFMDAVHHPLLGDSDVTRPGALLGNATDLGVVAVLVLAVLLADLVDVPRLSAIPAVGAAVLAIGLSGSRAALVGAVVAVGFLIAVRGRQSWHAGALAFVSLVVAALALPQTRDRLTAGATVNGRELLWKDAWRLGLDHPVLGAGPNRFVDTIGAQHGAAWVRDVGHQNPPDAAHNWVIQALDIGGFILLAACLALALHLAVIGMRRIRRDADPLSVGAAAGALAYGVMMLTHFPTSGTVCLAALLVGALVGQARGLEPIGRRVGRTLSAGAVVMVLALVAASVAEIPLQHGIDRAAKGDVDSADSSFSAAHLLRPWDSDIGMLAAQALAAPASEGDPRAARLAEGWAGLSLRRTPTSYDSLLARGTARLGLEQLHAAEVDLGRATTLNPTDPRAWLQLGIARFGLGDVAHAVANVKAAARLDPEDPTYGRVLEQMQAQLN